MSIEVGKTLISYGCGAGLAGLIIVPAGSVIMVRGPIFFYDAQKQLNRDILGAPYETPTMMDKVFLTIDTIIDLLDNGAVSFLK